MAAVAPLLLEALAPIEADLRGSLDDARMGLEGAEGLMTAGIAHHGAAKCAIDIALHDLVGKRLGLPVRELIGMTGDPPPTDFTLGLDEPSVVAERVDANTGWTPEAALELLPELERLGVELIEQPFPARRLDQLRWLQERSPLPLVADESAVTIEDLDALVGVVAGVNVKLAKCGGLGPARRMLERATVLGFRTFLGCMEETSIGIAASAAVAPLAEWIDLDGNLLLGDDPATGLELEADKRWRLADRPGLGLSLREDSRP
jgi:L-alanine-DL-glutamate epimerase-like enolase superfamily enzyme